MQVNATFVCPDGKYSLPGSDSVGDCVCPEFSSSKQNSRYINECICDAGYFRLYDSQYLIGGWYCAPCNPGQDCYNNSNYTCPEHSSSYAMAKSYLDCWCLSGFLNATDRTEANYCEECPANSYCTGKGAVQSCVANAISPVQSSVYTACFCDLGWKGRNNSACVACQSPTYCYGGVQAQCSEGTYSPSLAWDRLNCSCIAGRWGPTGGPCIVCSAGKYNTFPGCKACTNTTDLDCSLCELGTASSVLGRNTTCDVCPAGKYSFPANQKGALTCEACANGTVSGVGSGNCTSCLDGWYAVSGASVCTICPPGTWATGLVGSCNVCGPSTWCLYGVYYACPANSGHPFTMRSSQSDCTCNAGFIGMGSWNSSALVPGQTSPPPSWSGVNCASCPAGKYWSTQDLMAYYPFDSDNIYQDMSMNNNVLSSTNGASKTPTYDTSTNPFPGAGVIYMNNSDSSALLSSTQTMSAFSGTGIDLRSMVGTLSTPGAGFSICFWYKAQDKLGNPGTVHTIAWSNIFSFYSGASYIRWIRNSATANAGWYIMNAQGALIGSYLSPNAFTRTWTHMCLSISGRSWLHYYNCSNPTCSPVSGVLSNDIANVMNRMYIGRHIFDTAWYGWISEVRLYTKVLTPADVYAIRAYNKTEQNLIDNVNTNGSFRKCLVCPAGKYSTSIAAVDSSACVSCSIGKYSPTNGATTCLECTAGTYSTTVAAWNSTQCTPCSAGKYSTIPGALSPSNCSACLPGKISDKAGSVSCSECFSGTYATIQSSTCTFCAQGTYSGAQASTCITCGTGYFSLVNASACVGCPKGSYNDRNGSGNCSLCNPGSYSWGSASICTLCGVGKYKGFAGCYYCSDGTDEDCTLCSPGASSSVVGRTAGCDWCTKGKYSSPANSWGASTCEPCGNGTFSFDGAQTCFSCSLGTYAPAGSSSCSSCPFHTYLETGFKGSVEDCVACSAGTVSPFNGAMSRYACTACDAGKYEANRVCTDCSAGSFSNTGVTACGLCENGTFSIGGSWECTVCARGRYAPVGVSVCQECPLHTYLDESFKGSSEDCKACPNGTYTLVTGVALVSSCIACEAGKYELQRTCIACAAGKFSMLDGQTGCVSCGYGEFSMAGSSACDGCPAGSYSALKGRSNCSVCRSGTFSQGGVTACDACAVGSYSLENASACSPCPTGEFTGTNTSSNCSLCNAGTYSPEEGLSACLLCAFGTFAATTGRSVCQDCQDGYWAFPGSQQVGFLVYCFKSKIAC